MRFPEFNRKQIISAAVVVSLLLLERCGFVNLGENNSPVKNPESTSTEIHIDENNPEYLGLNYWGSGTVGSIPDGDTFCVNFDEETANRYKNVPTIDWRECTNVRVIGIDTPESVDKKTGEMCGGKDASKYAKQLLTDKKVLLFYEGDKVGATFNRLLLIALVKERSDSYVDLGADLISNGYAWTYWVGKKPAIAAKYEIYEDEARQAAVGIWDSCKYEIDKNGDIIRWKYEDGNWKNIATATPKK